MLKWLPAIVVVLWVLITTIVIGNSYHKIQALESENATLTSELQQSHIRNQVIIEEYNALNKIQDEAEANKKTSKEKTSAAKKAHANVGTAAYASKSDAGLLRQRSLEVRGDTTNTPGIVHR